MAVKHSLEEQIRRELRHLRSEEVSDLVRSIEKLVEAFHPDRIYVFGSQARGTATPDSDVDLMVIVPDSDQPSYRRAQAAYEAVGDHVLPLDLLVWTQQEFDERLPAAASLPATVAREGRLLHAS